MDSVGADASETAAALAAAQALSDPVFVVRAHRDDHGVPTGFTCDYANPAARSSVEPTAAVATLADLLGEASASVVVDLYCDALDSQSRRTVTTIADPTGSRRRWVEHDIVPIDSERLAVVLRDVTRIQELQSTLDRRSTYDALTGALNRESFVQLLGERLTPSHDPQAIAVLVCDLDHFQLVNQSLGHSIGDLLLVQAANRIRGLLRGSSEFARLSGDEFAVLLPGVDRVDEAVRLAAAITTAISEPFVLEGREVFVAVSIGIAVSQSGDRDASNLLRDAIAAVHRAKASGSNRFELYDDRMRSDAMARLQTETDLRRALERDELRVFYQPEVSFRSGRVIGAEALLRWQHPERGLLGAPEFIPIAEEAGLIIPLGEWVLEQACRQAFDWSQRYGSIGDVLVRVNLSARQLAEPTIVGKISEVLTATRCLPSRLCLEVTETLLIDDPDLCLGRLRMLHDLGVELAIDDFGTGYSSLGYLRQLPVDVVKIDQSFVSGLAGSVRDGAIVAAVVHLALALGLDVTAEGVETAEQLDRLVRLGVRRGQGFLFGRPMPAPLVESMFGLDVVSGVRSAVG
ncbi:MAG: putative bifunctional diguanylate cyclase/phosphodiesterase [Acidimicrobiia bacterium]